MKIIIGGNGSGKTKKIIEYSSAHNVPILCESKTRADRLLQKALGYGFKIPLPIVFGELNNANVEEVCIDEINSLLEKVFQVKVGAITINVDDIKVLEDLDKRI